MDNTLFLIFNHGLTDLQRDDAENSLGINRIVDMPEQLKSFWLQIPADLPEVASCLDPVKRWLSAEARKGDYVLIQGDFGACYLMVRHAFQMSLVPVYSTTERWATEDPLDADAVSITHLFRHVRFRKYGS